MIPGSMVPDIGALLRGWRSISKDEVLFALQRPGEFFYEDPDLRTDLLDEENPEAALRLFTEYEDAIRYYEQQRQLLQLDEEDHETLKVSRVTFRGVWELVPSICFNSNEEFGAPTALLLSTMGKDGFPVTLDVLWSEYATTH